MGAALIRFCYLRDGLFLAAVIAYGLNRWLVAPRVPSAFLRGHFNDLLLIPAALPIVLWVQRLTGLRTGDHPPTWPEIGLHLFVWSIISEYLGPVWLGRGTADALDVVVYVVGGLVAGAWWNRNARGRQVPP